ncbi:MAG: zf-HC2 domain-containing protein [Gemmatimonadaceae bacterium]|nr:zf-HC2 domain-containing protein [Gemmatimonadaceae bacterium]
MTDSTHDRPPTPPSLTCDEFAALLPAYLAGVTADADAWRLEWHAAHCVECETRLAQSVPVVASPDALLAALKPTAAEHAAMRATVLNAVAAANKQTTRSERRGALRWLAPVGLAAAAALTFMLVNRDPSSTEPTTPPDIASRPEFADDRPAPIVTAMQLANAQAAPEFAALDAAADELDAAIASAPNDRELRAFRSSLDARREELAQRIKSVSE